MATLEELSSNVLAKLDKDLIVLKQGPYACSSYELLSGGASNFTYRAQLVEPLPSKLRSGVEKTIVVKHAEPHLSLNTNFIIDVSRAFFEQSMLSALTTLSPTIVSGIHVSVPHLYHYDEATHTHLLSDLPNSVNLKDYLIQHDVSPEQSRRLGAAMGTWTWNFHDWAAAPEQQELREIMRKNTKMEEMKLNAFSGRIVATVDLYPDELSESRDLFEEVHKSIAEERRNLENGVLIHGDLWAGNVIIPGDPLPDEENNDSPHPIEVIDYELSRIEPASASICTDLAQCFAEFYLFAHFRGKSCGEEIPIAFLDAYEANGSKLSDDIRFQIAMHFAIHFLAITVRVGWQDAPEVNDLVILARDCITASWRKDKSWFTQKEGRGKNFLRRLFD